MLHWHINVGHSFGLVAIAQLAVHHSSVTSAVTLLQPDAACEFAAGREANDAAVVTEHSHCAGGQWPLEHEMPHQASLVPAETLLHWSGSGAAAAGAAKLPTAASASVSVTLAAGAAAGSVVTADGCASAHEGATGCAMAPGGDVATGAAALPSVAAA